MRLLIPSNGSFWIRKPQEQNPKTTSRWAQVAREGKKVMRFLSDRRYIANVVDGKVQFYGRGGRGE